MTWVLIIYFSTGVFADSRYTHFQNKKDCFEALHEIQKRPENYAQAWCAPEAVK